MSDGSFSYGKIHSQLSGLYVFIVTARTGSFTAAAKAFGMAQPTISQKISSLEGALGVSLFQRRNKGVELTSSGQQLFSFCAPHMREIESRFHSLLEPPNKNRVRLATDFAFSTYWLLPRLARLQEDFPGLDLQITTAHFPANVNRGDWDLMVEYSDTSIVSSNRQVLFTEDVAVVCSPAFYAKNGPFDTLDQLQSAPHISMAIGSGPEFFDWRLWYQEMNAPAQKQQIGISVGNYMLGCQACLEGNGLFLSPLEFVSQYLQSNDLVQAYPVSAKSARPYVIERKPDTHGLQLDVFNWICGVSSSSGS